MTIQNTPKQLINDGQLLVSAKHNSGTPIKTYDAGSGLIFIHRDSMGITGIVRASSFEDAYSICEDEFFEEACETIDELKADYGFREDRRKVIKSEVSEIHPQLKEGEKFAELSDYTDDGKLPEGKFVCWEVIKTPDPEAWPDNALFQEAFGFRPSGPNVRDEIRHGIYAKDINGDVLNVLTDKFLKEHEITLEIKEWEE